MLYLGERMVRLEQGDKISYDTAQGCVIISRNNQAMLFSRENSERFPIPTSDDESLPASAVEGFIRLIADLHGFQIKPMPNGDRTKLYFILVTRT